MNKTDNTESRMRLNHSLACCDQARAAIGDAQNHIANALLGTAIQSLRKAIYDLETAQIIQQNEVDLKDGKRRSAELNWSPSDAPDRNGILACARARVRNAFALCRTWLAR